VPVLANAQGSDQTEETWRMQVTVTSYRNISGRTLSGERPEIRVHAGTLSGDGKRSDSGSTYTPKNAEVPEEAAVHEVGMACMLQVRGAFYVSGMHEGRTCTHDTCTMRMRRASGPREDVPISYTIMFACPTQQASLRAPL
jgi:hypothetical protein